MTDEQLRALVDELLTLATTIGAALLVFSFAAARAIDAKPTRPRILEPVPDAQPEVAA